MGTLDEPTRPRPTTEYPRSTLKCVTSLRPNDVKTQKRRVCVDESAPTQEEDADSRVGGELDRKGALEDAKRGNREETSPDHLWERVGLADGSGRCPAEDMLTCHVPGGTWLNQVRVRIRTTGTFWGVVRGTREAIKGDMMAIKKYSINMSEEQCREL
ncbi:hypothetical protein NDU88_007164 [Pleurodeles waltl]|uniref:Uncharacterized protein n=1 Tax=Pleurodeles waltl TaxID=8319 RepID=A0AAV7VPN8_PLEWA|nr:hypothetical protein NDU88_007164 [Pleurodeles waltl]